MSPTRFLCAKVLTQPIPSHQHKKKTNTHPRTLSSYPHATHTHRPQHQATVRRDNCTRSPACVQKVHTVQERAIPATTIRCILTPSNVSILYPYWCVAGYETVGMLHVRVPIC